MIAIERQKQILNFISEKGHVSTNELCALLSASPATIRNDLNKLHKEKLIAKTHGGASILSEETTELISINEKTNWNFKNRENQHSHEKDLIAESALQYIQDNQCILLDGSSTALVLAKKLSRYNKLLVVTNGIYTMLALKDIPNINVIMLGGMVTKNSGSIEGILGIDLLNQLHIDTAFISANGFTEKDGLTDFNLYEVELKKIMLQNCNRIITLLDSSKFETISTASFLPSSKIDILLTDKNIPNELYQTYQSHGINIKKCSDNTPINT